MSPEDLVAIATSATAIGAVAIIFAAIFVYREAPKTVQLTLMAVAGLGIGATLFLQLGVVADTCSRTPDLILNELCAEGDECGPDGDFVEIFNPTDQDAELACYQIADRDVVRGGTAPIWMLPSPLPTAGVLPGGAVRAWGEAELGFKLVHKEGDGVRLYRVRDLGEHGKITRSIDEVPQISSARSYWYRQPDGGDWKTLPTSQQADVARLATFGAGNSATPAANPGPAQAMERPEATGPRTPPAEPRTAPREASAVVLRLGRRLAVVAADEDQNRVWATDLEAPGIWWQLPFPNGAAPLDDLEAAAPSLLRDGELYMVSSLSRTKGSGRTKNVRNRLARVSLAADGRSIARIDSCDGLRGAVLSHLVQQMGDTLPGLVEESPLDGGLNVEGLASWKDELLLGLRDPQTPNGGSIVVRLVDPEAYLAGCAEGQAPAFRPPVVLPTGPGLGIRGMAETSTGVLILLGSASREDDSSFELLLWDPDVDDSLEEVEVPDLEKLTRPEGIAALGDAELLLVEDLRDRDSQIERMPLPGNVPDKADQH